MASKHGLKSISLILKQRLPKPYKLWPVALYNFCESCKISQSSCYLQEAQFKITKYAHFLDYHNGDKEYKEFIWFLLTLSQN